MQRVADPYDAFLFDLDGVLYRGSEPVPFAAESVARLRAMTKRLAFVTNNSGRTPEAIAARLANVGIPAGVDEIETSALATAELLAARGVVGAFVVGEEGILQALRAKGITLVDAGATGVEVVVVGWDRHADYAKLRTAALFVERGATLVATNDDASFPAPDGNWPGAGALLAAIETTTGARAEVVGKPNPPVLRAALVRAGGGRPLVVGDRLDTDIAGAEGLGWDSLLVLTGISGRDDVAASAIKPTFIGDNLSALFAPPSH
jgi:HAD superfamily hydrolase (TIGR01457 family)